MRAVIAIPSALSLLLMGLAAPVQAQNKVDFLWVIQNSGSMADDQSTLAASISAFVSQLNSSGIDWRAAVAYTDSDRPSLAGTCTGRAPGCSGARGPGKGVVCPFTTDEVVLKCGTTSAAYVDAGTCGSGTERGLGSAAAAISDFLAGTGCLPGGDCSLRPGAWLAIIFFSDTGDQTTAAAPGQPDSSVASWINYFSDYDPATPGAQRAQVHGILCPLRPPTGDCTDNLVNPALFDRYRFVVQAMNGVEGSIRAADLPLLPQVLAQIVSAAATLDATDGHSGQTGPRLLAPAPNPVRESVTISIDVPAGGADLRVSLIDISGRRVVRLASGRSSAGRRTISWDRRDDRGQRVAPGYYRVVLESHELRLSRPVILIDR